MRFDLEVRIARPVADVFAYLTDVRNVPEWQESALSAEWIEEGKRFRERRSFLGRSAELELEVSEFEQDRRFDVRTMKAPVPLEIHHTFAAVDGGPQQKLTAEAKLSGALRFAGGMAKSQAERQFRNDLQHLKDLLENRATPKAGA
ncbi:MAG TPA: SRPBCC family protein [Gaiellaceae bacterium]|nr:SRPBCC family protein [Gaiellaceae bacterium]